MKRPGGFILVEVSITYVILALAIVALVPVFLMSIRAAKASEQIAVATQLSTELMEEVCLRKWDQKTPDPYGYITSGSAIGLDTGESAADKRTFNDIDDFNGWSENPPLDPVMNSLSGFSAYTRTVSVKYVTAALADSASATDYKMVSVCTGTKKLKPVCLYKIVANR